MTIHDLYRPLGIRFRRARIQAFYRAFNISSNTRVLDVGGTGFLWNIAAELKLPAPGELVMVNITEDPHPLPRNARRVMGDGRCMPFRDGEWDIAFSNSVIEHVGTREDQRAFASELRRVAGSYWVQTPDPRFFLEPHYIAPFVHWLPINVRRRIVRNFTILGWMIRPSAEDVNQMVNNIQLIPPRDFEALFPDAEIRIERFAGMPKSMIAVKR